MRKLFLIAGLLFTCSQVFSQQYMLIVRYDLTAPAPNAELIQSNAQHWGTYIKDLSASGKLVMALRPEDKGRTVTGKDKAVQEAAYSGDKKVVSSFFLVTADNLDEATEIAKKCAIYELGRSVEVRAVMDTGK